jgi:hypothetical protein
VQEEQKTFQVGCGKNGISQDRPDVSWRNGSGELHLWRTATYLVVKRWRSDIFWGILDRLRNCCTPFRFVNLMAPFFGAGGPMQLCLRSAHAAGDSSVCAVGGRSGQASLTDKHGVVENTVILMAPFFGAGGPMQLCL